MALNPVTYTEKIIGGFLRYQLGAYRFTDPRLCKQARALRSLEHPREPSCSAAPTSRSRERFAQAHRSWRSSRSARCTRTSARCTRPPHLFGHQERALRAILTGRHTLVSTGTGSGKTESFLDPIIDRCLRLRDENAPPGVVAVIVYPMNALAADQRGRLRDTLAGTDIPFALDNGSTPRRRADVHVLPSAPDEVTRPLVAPSR